MHEKVNELTYRGHSYRNFEPSEIRELLEDENVPNGDIREFFEFMESGRFEPMLYHTHKMFCSLDVDECETFWKNNPELLAWVSVWGKSEDLRDFQANPGPVSPPENVYEG